MTQDNTARDLKNILKVGTDFTPVKIVSTGAPCETRIYAQDGSEISHQCTDIVWSHKSGELPVATVTLALTAFEIDGEARFVDSRGKAVRRIEYEDGEVVEYAKTDRAPGEKSAAVTVHGTQFVQYVR